MKYDIVTIGDAFEDVLIKPEDMRVKEDRSFTGGYGVSFELGEKIPLSDVDYEIGGSACNTSVAFSRLGLRTSIVSILGMDAPSERITKRLIEEGVDTDNLIVKKDLKTNFSVIFRLDQGRTIFIYHGLKDYSIIGLKKTISSDWFFLAPLGENISTIEKDLVAQVSEKGSQIAWNPGAIQIKKGASQFRALLKNVSILFLNKEEAIKFVNYPVRPTDVDLFKRLKTFGPKIIVITNGKRGAKAFDGMNFYEAPAYDDVVRVDSTGAGDSFASGFLGCLISSGWKGEINPKLVEEALQWGIANSNSVVTEIGAQKGLLTVNAIEKSLSYRKSLRLVRKA